MGLADLANYYRLWERVLTVADECARQQVPEARRVREQVQVRRVRADLIRTSIYSRAVAKKMHWPIRKAYVF